MINDTLINEITQNPTICNLAVGSLMGAGALVYAVGRFMFFALLFYIIYRVTKVFIERNKAMPFKRGTKQIKHRKQWIANHKS